MLNVEEDSDLRREDEDNREGAKKMKEEDECLWCLLLRILKVYRSSSDSGYTLYTSKRHHTSALIMIMILIITLLPSLIILFRVFKLSSVSNENSPCHKRHQVLISNVQTV